MKRILLWTLGIFLTVVGISKNPMLLIFPMWIFTYLNRAPLRQMVRGMSLSASFIGSGLCFGLLTDLNLGDGRDWRAANADRSTS